MCLQAWSDHMRCPKAAVANVAYGSRALTVCLGCQDILALEPQFGRVPKPQREDRKSDATDYGQSSGVAKVSG